MTGFINNLPMWKKQLLSFLLIMLLPNGLVLLLTFSMNRIVFRNITEQAVNSVERMSLRIENILSVAYTVSSSIAYDRSLKTFITTDYDTQFERISASWQNGDLSFYTASHTYELDGLFVYSDAYNVLNTGYIKNTPDYVKAQPWYQRACTDASPFWAYVENDTFLRRNRRNLALCRGISSGSETLGVLCIYINDETLASIARQEDFSVMICDASGRILAAREEALRGSTLEEAGIRLEDTEKLQSVRYEGEQCRAICKSISVPGTRESIRVVALYSEAMIYDQTNRVSLLTYVLIAACSAASIGLVFLLSKLLTDRLVRVSADIHHIANGELDYEPRVDGADEIGRLSGDLSLMLINLRRLISENYAIRLQKQQIEANQKAIQLQVLSSQLNPHFLFNTLESIRMQALVNADTDAAGAIKMLSSFLRKSLYVSQSTVPLSEELGLVEDYLSLQKLRFGESLAYRLKVSADASRPILPFLLQPLVENALRHGIEESPRGSHYVLVEVWEEDGLLLISIADNGAGMPPEALERIREALRTASGEPPREHIGLLNVSQRIRLYYGEQYGLNIRSTPGSGTVVTVTLSRAGSGLEE